MLWLEGNHAYELVTASQEPAAINKHFHICIYRVISSWSLKIALIGYSPDPFSHSAIAIKEKVIWHTDETETTGPYC